MKNNVKWRNNDINENDNDNDDNILILMKWREMMTMKIVIMKW